jgi:hypothetical protein
MCCVGFETAEINSSLLLLLNNYVNNLKIPSDIIFGGSKAAILSLKTRTKSCFMTGKTFSKMKYDLYILADFS